MIVVLIIGILMMIAVPNFIKGRENARRSTCIANLKATDLAKEQWAMDNKKDAGDTVEFTDLVGPTLYMKTTPACQANGTYTINPIGANPTCDKPGHVMP